MPLDAPSVAGAGQRVRPCITGVSVRSKVWLEVRGEFAIGQGGVELLAAIAERGSLTRAARHVGWSYRHAWGYVRRAERVLGMSLLVTRSGKGATRGTQLTSDAEQLVRWLGSLQ